jgi:hypothetical protein
MRWVMLALSTWLLHQSPARAQTGSPIDQARLSFTSVHQYVAHEAIPTQLAPPINLLVSSIYRPLIDSMLRDSPTFRRQCMRIAAEPALIVRLSIGTIPFSSAVRAISQIRKVREGGFSAVIEIASQHDLEELIAHELEHVIEQLDGVDLAARAALRNTGVTAIGYAADVFETTRAKRAGLRVAAELSR